MIFIPSKYSSNFTDLTNRRYGQLVVIRAIGRDNKSRNIEWLCKCDCGKEITVISRELKKRKSCGCLSSIELSGRKFGKLQVVRRIGTKYGAKLWLCECECGNCKKVVTHNLIANKVISCGCMIGKRRNIAGFKFGKLTAICETTERRNGCRNIVWQCRCDCGAIVIATTSDLVSGHKISCGCSRKRSNSKHWTGYEHISGQFWGNVKRSANKRKLDFLITINDAWKQYQNQNCKCALTGKEIIFSDHSRDTTASLDRRNSANGYTSDNIQWVHKKINLMKGALDEIEFISLCRAVVDEFDKDK
jgi:hypothetical protein